MGKKLLLLVRGPRAGLFCIALETPGVLIGALWTQSNNPSGKTPLHNSKLVILDSIPALPLLPLGEKKKKVKKR